MQPAVTRPTGALAGSLAALMLFAGGASDVRAQGSGNWPDTWQIGGMILVAPKYEGSKDYQVLGVPFIAPAGLSDGNGWVDVKGADDVRFRLLQTNGFEAGPLAGWRFGRDEDDARRLQGLGDVDGGLVLGGYAAYRTGPLKAFVSYHHQATGDDTGGLARFGLEAKTVARGIAVTGLLGATWASDDYMDSFFSVSPAQAIASPVFGRFEAESGIKDLHVGVAGDVPLDDRWTLKLTGRYAHLVGDAADSPISETNSQFFGGVGLTYRFSMGR